MVGMGDGSPFGGPVNGILCIFSTYLGRLARAVPSNLQILKKLKQSIMYVLFSTLILHEQERYVFYSMLYITQYTFYIHIL